MTTMLIAGQRASSVVAFRGVGHDWKTRCSNIKQTLRHPAFNGNNSFLISRNLSRNALDYPCLVSYLWRTAALTPMDESSSNVSIPPQYALVRVVGDGNCLFRALTQSYHVFEWDRANGIPFEPLSPEEESIRSEKLRQDICDMLVSQKEFVEPFLPSCDVNSYASKMRENSTWGGEPELSMASLVLDARIGVYRCEGHKNNQRLEKISEYDLQSEQRRDKEVSVLYSGGFHYDALIFPNI